MTILSVNPIDMDGRVEADAKSFDLPYTVLVGRESSVIKDYRITELPRILLIGSDGRIAAAEKFLSEERLLQAVERSAGKKR